MSFSNLLVKNNLNNYIRNVTPLVLSIRGGHTLRGKPPGVAKTLEQRLREEKVEDPELTARVNIGFPGLRQSRSAQLTERLKHLKQQRANAELEKLARNNTLLIDLDKVQQEYRNTTAFYDVRTIADHYGVFQDLFGSAYFVPRVNLNVKYQLDEETYSQVYNGNIIKPAEAAKPPEIKFEGNSHPIHGKQPNQICRWSIIATNPDAMFDDPNSECLHYFIGNITQDDLSSADIIADYLPPFPPRGVGYQRFIYILYNQTTKIDFSEYKVSTKDYANLEKRKFNTLEFYRKYQDVMTPAGLCFFQSDWDTSITDFYHKVLQIKEPIYEYDFPAPYLTDPKRFPLKQPFNLYMDKHRDIKQVNKEYLERKLAKTHPFKGPEKPLRFPNAHPIRDVPSWLRTEIRKNRLGIGRINDY